MRNLLSLLISSISILALSGCDKLFGNFEKVGSIPYIDFVVVNVNPNTLQASFNNIIVQNGTIKSSIWEFGDGTTFNGLTPPVKTYPRLTGTTPTVTYRVKLTVENEFGKAYWTKDIKIGPCLATVNFSVTTVNDSTIQITNQSSSPTSVNYLWQFGDGTGGINNSPVFTKTYSSGGVYNIILTATNSCGDNSLSKPQTILKLPSVVTVGASMFNGTTTMVSGNVVNTGGYPVNERGICWSPTVTTPTLANSRQAATGPNNNYSVTISALSTGTTYYARAYATTVAGTSYGQPISFRSSYSVSGAGPSGGLVFYDKTTYSNGWRYLEAAPSDQSTQSPWGCRGTLISNLLAGLGEGLGNTNRIVSLCPAPTIAARICNDAVINGYDDWYLPNRDEAFNMYTVLKLNGRGNFLNQPYQTSTETNSLQNVTVSFSNGSNVTYFKNDSATLRVRAVRRF